MFIVILTYIKFTQTTNLYLICGIIMSDCYVLLIELVHTMNIFNCAQSIEGRMRVL